MLAASFAPCAPLGIAAARVAKARNMLVLAITDSPFSPLVPACDVWLELAEADYGAFRSLAAAHALAVALANGAGVGGRQAALTRSKRKNASLCNCQV